MDNLPPEIVSDILSRLPMRSFGQCRKVCKAWKDIIDDPKFFQQHIPHVNGLGEDSLDNLQDDLANIVERLNQVKGHLRDAIKWKSPMDSFTIQEVSNYNTALLRFNMIHNLLDGGSGLQELLTKLQSDYSGRRTTYTPAQVIEHMRKGSMLYFVEAQKKLR